MGVNGSIYGLRDGKAPYSPLASWPQISVSWVYFAGGAMLIYGLFSEPTPSALRIQEVFVGALLVASVFLRLKSAVQQFTEAVYWLYAIWLVPPLIVGFFGAFDDEPRQIIRDLIAHVYLMQVILIGYAMPKKQAQFIGKCAALAGGFVAIRFLQEAGFRYSRLGEESFTFDGKMKLNTEPLIVFAGIWSAYAVIRTRSYLWLAAWASTLLVCMLCVTVSNMRGPTVMVAIACILSIFDRAVHSSSLAGKAAIALAAPIGLLYVGYRLLESGVLAGLISKNEAVGASNKIDEALLLIENYPSSVPNPLIGNGWGSFMEVRPGAFFAFSHNMQIYYAYKSGMIVGAISLLSCVVLLLIYIWCSVKQKNAFLMSLVPMMVYGWFVNPMFKFFGFGVFCLMAAVALRSRGEFSPGDR